jgi:hypothetical protein
MAATYKPPTLAEIQYEIDRLKGLITTYEDQIKGFKNDQKTYRANTTAQQVIIDRITKSTGNTKTVSNWTGVTSYTADVGFVTTLISPPTDNSTIFYIPAGADVNFEYDIGTTNVLRIGRPIFKENNWVNPSYTYHPTKTLTNAESYRNQTINIQWNLHDVAISMEHVKDSRDQSKPTGKVLLFNLRTGNYVRIQLMLPQKNCQCGVNVYFTSGHTIALIAARELYANYSSNCLYIITEGNLTGNEISTPGNGPGTYYWKAGKRFLLNPYLRDLRNTFNSMPYKDKTTYLDFLAGSKIALISNMDKNAYYFKNRGVVQSPLVTALQPYKNIIIANDKAINALETRIKDTTKLLDDTKIKLVAEQNKADTYVAPPVVTPVIPSTVINNNTTITNINNVTNTTNVTNVTNVNLTSTVTNNINQTFYNVNTGVTTKPTTPTIQLPPPIDLAALLASLFGKK